VRVEPRLLLGAVGFVVVSLEQRSAAVWLVAQAKNVVRVAFSIILLCFVVFFLSYAVLSLFDKSIVFVGVKLISNTHHIYDIRIWFFNSLIT